MTDYIYVWTVWYRSPSSSRIEHKEFTNELGEIEFKLNKLDEGCRDVGMNCRIRYL